MCGTTAKSSLPDVEAPRARAGPEHADDGVGLSAETNRPSNWVDIREQGLQGGLPDHDYPPPMSQFALCEEASHLHVDVKHVGVVVGGAQDVEQFRPLTVVEQSGSGRWSTLAEDEVDTGDRRRLTIDGIGIARGKTGTSQQLGEILSRCQTDPRELNDEDRVRPDLTDALAQRLVEPSDDGRHTDD